MWSKSGITSGFRRQSRREQQRDCVSVSFDGAVSVAHGALAEHFPCPALLGSDQSSHRSVSGSSGNWEKFKKPGWMPIGQGLLICSPKYLAKKDVDA